MTTTVLTMVGILCLLAACHPFVTYPWSLIVLQALRPARPAGAAEASGGYSLVVNIVHSTAARNTAAPKVNESFTAAGTACADAAAPDTPARVSSHGSADAITAPNPINRLCMANPWVRCSSGNRSATKARNGSMLMLIDASNIQSRPAAIHSVEAFGIARRAAELRIAPPRK